MLKHIWRFTLLSSVVLVFLTACSEPTPKPTPTIDSRTPIALTAQAGTATQDSIYQEETRVAQLTEEANATSTAQAAVDNTATAIIENTATAFAHEIEMAATATQKSADIKATNQAMIEGTKTAATAQADPMAARIESLYAEGHLDTTEGVYYSLPDFDERWAQINYYRWWRTGYSPSNFVVRADASWDSASTTANWFTSGCGFVFREDKTVGHYFGSLNLDGYVTLQRNVNGVAARLGRSYYGPLEVPKGSAEIMMVVNHEWILIFVNGELVHQRQDTALEGGNLALTLVSGTNVDWGTRCTMKNIDLWELP